MAKRKGEFAWSPIRRYMRASGAEIVSKQAVQVMIDFLEKRAKELTAASVMLAKHAKRKKVSAADMKLAIESK